MADQSDVEAALVALAAGVLYPLGVESDSIVNKLVRIYRGWPNPAALDADLAAGIVNVSVFADAAQQRNTTRWLNEEGQTATIVPALTVATDGHTVTFAGTALAGQLAGVLMDNFAAVHRTRTGDTPGRVAAILAAEFRTQGAVQLAGAAITLPGATRVIGRVFADQPWQRTTRRQSQAFRLSCWCPDPLTRDAVAAAIDAAFSAVDFIALADGTTGRLHYRSSVVLDRGQDASLYRRDLTYEIDYPTTLSTMLPSMLFGDLAMVANDAGAIGNLLS